MIGFIISTAAIDDSDGKTDLGFSRSENGNLVWYVLQSSNNQMRNYYWGIAGDR